MPPTGRAAPGPAAEGVCAAEIVSVPLHPEEYAFVGAPGTEFADASDHTLCDLAPDLPLFRYLLDRVGGPTWPFRHREYLGGIAAVKWRVLHGAGVAVLPRRWALTEIERGDLVAVKIPELSTRRVVRFVFRRAGDLSHAASAFLQLVKDRSTR